MRKKTTQKSLRLNQNCVLYHGDCVDFLANLPSECIDLTITSPPYFMGKDYDKSTKIEDFIDFHKRLLPEIVRVTKKGGNICWQVGHHVKNGIATPLDFVIHGICINYIDIFLRNRIIWTYGHGLHGSKRFSGRHESVLWYTKGDDYYFDLDSIRVPQKYPGKRYYKGKKKGEYSGNPLGKNPSDVWEIPNIKANHIEKTDHPCQFPIALAQRLVRALCPNDGKVFDPFMGSGATGIAAILEKRRFIGCEIDKKYYRLSKDRCKQALSKNIKYRPVEKPIFEPDSNMAVAIKPSNFK